MSSKKNILYFVVFLGCLGAVFFTVANSNKISKCTSIFKDFLLSIDELTNMKEDILYTDVPVSDSGLMHYAQGGIVVDGVAYFTADSHDRERGKKYKKSPSFPYVVSFDVQTFQKIRTYAFEDTYDSTPLVLKTKDGRKLLLAHEYLQERTKAVYADTGNTAWVSPDNQPGAYFFGYSYYSRLEGGKTVLAPSGNGLHALNLKSGQEMWHKLYPIV